MEARDIASDSSSGPTRQPGDSPDKWEATQLVSADARPLLNAVTVALVVGVVIYLLNGDLPPAGLVSASALILTIASHLKL